MFLVDSFEFQAERKLKSSSLLLISSAEIPSNMILAHTRPSLFLPGLTFLWGIVVTLISLVKSKEGLIVARLFLGFVEYAMLHFSCLPCLSKYNCSSRNAPADPPHVNSHIIIRSGFFPGVVSGQIILLDYLTSSIVN